MEKIDILKIESESKKIAKSIQIPKTDNTNLIPKMDNTKDFENWQKILIEHIIKNTKSY